MYVLSASNGCFEILSVVLTLHAAHLSSSLRVEYTTNRFLILSTKIEKWSHLQASSGLLSESFNLIICYNFRKGQVVFFWNKIWGSIKFHNVSKIHYEVASKFLTLSRVASKFFTLSSYWCKPYKKNNK